MTALPGSGTFAMVDPTHVAAVGPAAAILYARISWRARDTGEWTATRRILLSETGLTDAMLRTAVAVLREREWVSTRRVSADDATLVWKPLHAGHAEIAESTPPPSGIRTTPPVDSAISSIETGKSNNPPPPDGGLFEPAPLRVVPTTAELDAEFVRFWELYPRRTAKKAARAAYGRARRTATVQQIATGLRAQLPLMAQQEPQYVPHPTTWLNQGRWEDEVQRPQGPVTGSSDWERSLPPPRTDPFARGAL